MKTVFSLPRKLLAALLVALPTVAIAMGLSTARAESLTGPLAGGLRVTSLRSSGLSLNNISVPIGGFTPWVGLGLTNEFDDGSFNETFFQAANSSSPGGTALGLGGTPYYGVALFDTGAQVDLLSNADRDAFDLAGAGFLGTEQIAIGGATGFVLGDIEDPLGVYAAGLSEAISTGPLMMNTSALQGQTSVSVVTAPSSSSLPSIIGIPMASQYTTVIRNDQPQIITTGGKTYRSPDIEFLPLGEGANQGIVRRAPMFLGPGEAFLTPPIYIFNLDNILMGEELYEDPTAPTFVPGGFFLTVNVADGANVLTDKRFFFDTGAEVTVVSQLVAAQLGFDAVLDTPDFVVDIEGSGGTVTQVPGFVADQFNIVTVGGSFTLQNVPLVVLDVVDTSDPGNIVPGIVGTNLFQGRNLVIDPTPALGGGGPGPSLYISDVVLETHDWATAAASGTWDTPGNWSTAGTPGNLWIANVTNVAGTPQQAVVDASSIVNQIVVSGGASQMELVIQGGATLTVFGNVDVQASGEVDLSEGTLLSADNILLNDGSLTGAGSIIGDVTNQSGVVAPGASAGILSIDGIFAQRIDGTLEIELGGLDANTSYDRVRVDGLAVIDGTLDVALIDLFVPEIGNSFEILTATDGVSGTFATLGLPGLSSGLMWSIDYGATDVTLEVIAAMLGDMNGDGLVNLDDTGPFVLALTDRSAYDALYQTVDADILGDMNMSGTFDVGDISALSSLLSSSSASATSPAVPEPSSLVLVLLGAAGMVVSLRRR